MSSRTFVARLAVVALAATGAGALACGGGSSTSPQGCTPTATTVCMTPSNTFNPSSTTITKGGSVTWSNTTGVTHNVTFTTAGAPASIGNFASGTRSATFPTAGSFAYNCTIHGLSMSGTVVVQ